MIISSFFTQNGAPKTGLSPTVLVWQISAGINTIVVNNAAVSEVGNGFYSYNFAAYNPAYDYLISVDAGVSMTAYGRYSVSQLTPSGSVTIDSTAVTQIVDGVWDASATAHMISGSTGETLATIKADTTAIAVSIPAMNAILQRLLKYDDNRTRIDKVAKTLTVYDDDGVTPIQVFNLKDSLGAPSVAEVAERVPTI